MKYLQRLQRNFQDYVLHHDKRMHRKVVSTPKAAAHVRLGIYADAYHLRLLESLETDYPGLKALAGEEEFKKLGLAYIETHPSPYFNIRWYGDRMAEFLGTTPPYNDRPALGEMAAFEWAMTLAFDAHDDPLVSVEKMAAIPPEAWAEIIFFPHASLQRLRLSWNVPGIWKANGKKEPSETPRRVEPPVEWVLWRSRLTPYFRSLGPDEAWAMDAMIAGKNFAEICEGLCEWIAESEVASRAASLLKQWVTDGLVREVKV